MTQDNLRECFAELDLKSILIEQNESSINTITGIIWVLNTSVFLVPDYNFRLLDF